MSEIVHAAILILVGAATMWLIEEIIDRRRWR